MFYTRRGPVALVLVLQALLLKPCASHPDLSCRSLLQTRSKASEGDYFFEELSRATEELSRATEELRRVEERDHGPRRDLGSRSHGSTSEIPSQNAELLSTAADIKFRRDMRESNSSSSSSTLPSNSSSNSTWPSASEAVAYVKGSWSRVWTAIAVFVGLQLALFLAFRYGGFELLGKWKYTVLRITCLGTMVPLMVYIFYELGFLQTTLQSLVPFLVAGSLIFCILLPLVAEIIIAVQERVDAALSTLDMLNKHFEFDLKKLEGELEDVEGELNCQTWPPKCKNPCC